VAERLGAEGAAVVLNYLGADAARDGSEIDAAVAAVKAYGGEVDAIDADVSDAHAVKAMIERAEARFGRVDIVVNNAGIAALGAVRDFAEADWDRTVAVNLKSQFLVARAVIGSMCDRRDGQIVNISSELGLVGESGLASYCASKAGVIGFTKSLAREVAAFGVRVNCVAPGPTDTAILRDEERTAEYAATIPLGRLGAPTDIASSVWFLVSPEASWITGQVLSPNGGAVI
jgi:3-oxoacyl-[acyl-carrier protein] reductase